MSASGRNPATTIRRALASLARGPGGFRCGFCGLSFEADRPNCPACGGPVEKT